MTLLRYEPVVLRVILEATRLKVQLVSSARTFDEIGVDAIRDQRRVEIAPHRARHLGVGIFEHTLAGIAVSVR
jgi:hypothetical protein